jgi:hypothetical protein
LHLIHLHSSGLQAILRYRYSTHIFQFTLSHALEFSQSVFASRILATDLSQSHCNFKLHVKSSCHSLISFLPFLLSHLGLSSLELDTVFFRLLFCTPALSLLLLFCQTLLLNTLHGHHGKHCLIWSRMHVYWSVT